MTAHLAHFFLHKATGVAPALQAGAVSLSSHTSSSLTWIATEATGGTPPYTKQWKRALALSGPFVNVGSGGLTFSESSLPASFTEYAQVYYTDALGAVVSSAIVSGTTDASSGGLTVAVHPDYTVTWEPPGIAYYAGEKRPLKWTVVRNDGAAVDSPSGGTVTVTAPDGTQTVLTPDVESSDPAVTTVVAQDYLFATAGYYSAKLLLEIGNQIVGTETPISIDA